MTHSREIAASIQDEECGLSVRMVRLERENRKLGRDVAHLKNALVQEKMAATTLLNQHKASTFITGSGSGTSRFCWPIPPTSSCF